MGNIFQPDSSSGFILAATTTSVSSTAGQFNANQESFYVYNSGASLVHLRWGKGAQTALVTDLALPSGSIQTFGKEGADTIAVICDTGTATVYVAPGEGQ